MKVKRALAYPLAVGSEVKLVGRVKECADLVAPGRRLLDIGCSSGWLASLVLEKGFHQYIGIDRVIVGSPAAETKVSFVEGSALHLPFDDGSFDTVCLFDVIEHLPRGTERNIMREIHRVLEGGGKLYFSTPHASPVHTLLDPVWLLGHRHYRRRTIRTLLQSADFVVDRIFVAGGVVEALDHIRLLAYRHALHRNSPPIGSIHRLVELSHGRDHRLGTTIFAAASRSMA